MQRVMLTITLIGSVIALVGSLITLVGSPVLRPIGQW
jgi:hypothetical protein